MITDPKRRHDFLFVFDVQDGNPNGDPDGDNRPRTDPLTSKGLVTDVCLKRKIRDYVAISKEGQPGYDIYVQRKGVLVDQRAKAYKALKVEPNGKKPHKEKDAELRAWMCKNFYDIRAFGAVMTLTNNTGQVQGPVQLVAGRSVDRIFPSELTITRVAVEDSREGEKETEMGRKWVVPYGLYVSRGFINPVFAAKTGFSNEDLKLLWQAMPEMFELDRSAARGLMSCRGLYVFTHDTPYGKAPAHKLFDTVGIAKKKDVEFPSSFEDYDITIEEKAIPSGVKLTRIVD